MLRILFARSRRFIWLSWQQLYYYRGDLYAADFYTDEGKLIWIGTIVSKKFGWTRGISLEQFLESATDYKTFWMISE